MPELQKYYKTPIIFLNSTNECICCDEHNTLLTMFLINSSLSYQLAYKGFRKLIFIEPRTSIPSHEQSSTCIISKLSTVISGVLAAQLNILNFPCICPFLWLLATLSCWLITSFVARMLLLFQDDISLTGSPSS